MKEKKDGSIEDNTVVYTAVFGDYDILLRPRVVPDEVDFICFTDNPSNVCGAWEPRVVTDYSLSPSMLNRKLKILPHRYLIEYRYSVYIDANIYINNDITKKVDENLGQASMAVANHRQRKCLYEEAKVCVNRGLADPDVVNRQIRRYRKEGLPKNYGLSANRVLIRKHNSDDIVNAMNMWWKELQKGASRDQLSFQYVVWKTDIDVEMFDNKYADKSGTFIKYPHKTKRYRNTLVGKVAEWKIRIEREETSGILRQKVLSFLYHSLRVTINVKNKVTGLYHNIKEYTTNGISKIF